MITTLFSASNFVYYSGQEQTNNLMGRDGGSGYAPSNTEILYI